MSPSLTAPPWLRRLSIRQRLLGSVGVVALAILVLGLWASAAYRQLQQDTDAQLARQLAVLDQARALETAVERLQRLEQEVLLASNNVLEARERQQRWQAELKTTQGLLQQAGAAGAGALAPLGRYGETVAPVLQQVSDARIDTAAAHAYTRQAGPDLA
ncbi:hypothetical protein [Ideonella livida]|uniref:Chemotaxis protein n=1 Tax=Ideonella livida TaxID=2707176 RepID=A0A7C9TK16_9BURK|nr:hypothetical protein [Ideonella livida]NDY91542.1 hypothetical protein [Ideonella livida]